MSLTAKEYGKQPSQCGDASNVMVQLSTGESRELAYRASGLTKHERLCEIAFAAIIAKSPFVTVYGSDLFKETAAGATAYADAMCELLAART